MTLTIGDMIFFIWQQDWTCQWASFCCGRLISISIRCMQSKLMVCILNGIVQQPFLKPFYISGCSCFSLHDALVLWHSHAQVLTTEKTSSQSWVKSCNPLLTNSASASSLYQCLLVQRSHSDHETFYDRMLISHFLYIYLYPVAHTVVCAPPFWIFAHTQAAATCTLCSVFSDAL